jgi:hypothetical protein
MIPREPLWRYKLYGDSMPWYESVSLFRQKKEWSGVINEVANELRRRTSNQEDSRRDMDRVHGKGLASVA